MSFRDDVRAIQRHVGVKVDGIFGPVSAAAVREHLRPTLGGMPAERAVDFEFDERTERNLRTLLPKAQRGFRPFIAQAMAVAAGMGVELKAISGTRTYAEQARLRRRWKAGKGGKAAAPGYSNHNFGIALDLGCFKARRYLDGSKKRAERELAMRVYEAISHVADKYGIDWGGDWRGRDCDPPHFEVRTGLSMNEKRALVAAGKEVL